MREREMPHTEYIELCTRLPDEVLCSTCYYAESSAGNPNMVILELECTCFGTQREPCPFTEVLGLVEGRDHS
jgi:hypothetical protein